MSETPPAKETSGVQVYEPGAGQTREKGTEQPELDAAENVAETAAPRELGGPTGPEPTRYGDWERKGRCIDF